MMDLSFLPETNWVDIIVVIFLVRGSYIGLIQGFSVEFFKTLGAILTCVLALFYYGRLGEWLAFRSFLSLQIANFLSFLALFLALLFIFRILRVVMFNILRLELFGGLEKWGGFTLGLLRSVVLASLFLFLFTLLPGEYIKESIDEKSLSGPYLKEVAPKIFDFFIKFKPKTTE